MALFPPEVLQPFSLEEERQQAKRLLAKRADTLRFLINLANQPPSEWTPEQISAFPHTTSGVSDPPPERLRRWSVVFADEIAEVKKVAESQRPLGDIEMRQVLYLAARLIATVLDKPANEVDSVRLPAV